MTAAALGGMAAHSRDFAARMDRRMTLDPRGGVSRRIGMVTMKWRWWIVFLCLASFFAILPFLGGWAWSTNGFEFGAYGSWLQGTLTPISLLLALITFQSQARSQRDTNLLLGKTFFMDVKEKYEGHLNYLAGAAVRGEYLPAADVKKKARMYFVNEVVKGEVTLQECEQLTHLKISLNKFVRLAKNCDSSEFVNRDVLILHKGLENGQFIRHKSEHELATALK
jgi:hypothetical protein